MGCSPSKVESSVLTPVEVKSDLPVAVRRATLNQQSNRVMENFVIVWLLHHSSLDVEKEKIKLSHIASWVKTFTDSNDCRTYIASIRIEKIFLIVPTVDTWLESMQNLPQIEKIYVLDSTSHVSENAKDIPSSSNMFDDIDTLCKQMQTDVELCELDLVTVTASPISIQDGNTAAEFKRQEASFLSVQLMREILFRLKFGSNAKIEFVNFFRMHYADNEEQLRILDDFEQNYRPQKALSWLIRQCFIWRVIQRIQRTQDIDINYKIGFFLKHVYAQLNHLQENHSSIEEKKWIIYRGKTMPKDWFETMVKKNCGGLLSIGSIFTAETNREVAIDFICRRLFTHPQTAGILFEIHINPAVRSTRSPLASLEEIYSTETNEKDGILFSAHTVFRIESVEQITQQSIIMWLVQLTLIVDDDPQLLRIVSPLRSTEVYSNPLSYMGKLFIDNGDYEQAEQFFLAMLQDSCVLNQPRRLVRVHKGLGANYMNKGEYGKALEHYQQALETSLSFLTSEHTDLVSLYDGIGNSYYKLGDYSNAVENYEKAANLLGHSTQPNNEELINKLTLRINGVKTLISNKQ